MLHKSDRHFQLRSIDWNAYLAMEFAENIMQNAVDSYRAENFWPAHPLDSEKSKDPLPTMYFGTEGVAWGLHHWQKLTGKKLRINSSEILETVLNRVADGDRSSSLFFGDTGTRIALQSISPSLENFSKMKECLTNLQSSKSNEIMAGAPGALIALQHLWTMEQNESLLAVIQTIIKDILEKWVLDPTTNIHVWRQHYGKELTYLGAAHGAVGNIYALLRVAEHMGPQELQMIQERAISLVTNTALENETEANWPAILPAGEKDLLVHWCHGATGVVMALADRIPIGLSARFDQILLKAGNLIWNAGGLVLGPSLCHGTSGSGAALLKLYERTGDEIWLKRARSFAMNSIEQIKEHELRYKQQRFSLWTGDIGSAFFFQACLKGRFSMPLLDVI